MIPSTSLFLVLFPFFSLMISAAPPSTPAQIASRQMTRAKLIARQNRPARRAGSDPSAYFGVDCSNAPNPLMVNGRSFNKDCGTIYYTGGTTNTQIQSNNFVACVQSCGFDSACLAIDFYPYAGSTGEGTCTMISKFGPNGVSPSGAFPDYSRAYLV